MQSFTPPCSEQSFQQLNSFPFPAISLQGRRSLGQRIRALPWSMHPFQLDTKFPFSHSRPLFAKELPLSRAKQATSLCAGTSIII